MEERLVNLAEKHFTGSKPLISKLLKISVIDDFAVLSISFHLSCSKTKTSCRTFRHISFSCCYGTKSAVNFIFFLTLAFNNAKNWTDFSFSLGSFSCPCGFYYYCKALCLCLSVIRVHILTHTGARARVKL